ncbi:MAG TPA: hypothetical protein DEF30_05215 [Proteiniclasticum sp.]|nr:hypothetical protein [Proteiniclasticum sp.]
MQDSKAIFQNFLFTPLTPNRRLSEKHSFCTLLFYVYISYFILAKKMKICNDSFFFVLFHSSSRQDLVKPLLSKEKPALSFEGASAIQGFIML